MDYSEQLADIITLLQQVNAELLFIIGAGSAVIVLFILYSVVKLFIL